MRTLLDNDYLRSELEAPHDISNLRECVTRLEVERGASANRRFSTTPRKNPFFHSARLLLRT
jgi:hypothetical protein